MSLCGSSIRGAIRDRARPAVVAGSGAPVSLGKGPRAERSLNWSPATPRPAAPRGGPAFSGVAL